MKKLLAALALLVVGCASKSSAPTAERPTNFPCVRLETIDGPTEQSQLRAASRPVAPKVLELDRQTADAIVDGSATRALYEEK